eukprot:352470-Chlamydomonas_euryale.AAC.1
MWRSCGHCVAMTLRIQSLDVAFMWSLRGTGIVNSDSTKSANHAPRNQPPPPPCIVQSAEALCGQGGLLCSPRQSPPPALGFCRCRHRLQRVPQMQCAHLSAASRKHHHHQGRSRSRHSRTIRPGKLTSAQTPSSPPPQPQRPTRHAHLSADAVIATSNDAAASAAEARQRGRRTTAQPGQQSCYIHCRMPCNRNACQGTCQWVVGSGGY